MIQKTCAFTGHRPHKFPWKYNEADPRCTALKALLAEQISALAAEGVTEFYNGGAEGADFWTAQIVLAMQKKDPALKLHLILPWEGQAGNWSEAAQERYYAVLGQASSIEYVSRAYREGCLLERNRRLVESAALLLAVYNGERRGGTAATVRCAQRLGREVRIIDPMTLAVT